MNVLFINPPWWQQDGEMLRQGIRAGSRWPFTRPAPFLPDHFRFGAYLPFPYFLASAAAYARKALPDCLVRIRDSVARGESYYLFATAMERDTPDWLIVESATPSWAHDSAFLLALKVRYPDVKIIITGTITAAHDFTLPGWAHAAIRGEYEKGVVAVIKGEASGIVPFNLLTKAELNEIPYPLFDPMCELNYWDSCPEGQQAPHLPLLTSRGCPHKCAFCAWPATMTGNDPDGTKARSVRLYDPEWVRGFIEERLARGLRAGRPYRSVYFDDDTFNLVERHVVEMCHVMQGVGLPWTAMCRADTISEDAWRLMRQSGCVGVKIGIESASQRVLDKIVGKKLDFRAVEEKWLPLLRELGFRVHTTWTVGLPGETSAEMAETEAAIQRFYDLGLHHTHQLSGTAVIEGTPLDKIARGEKLERFPDAKLTDDFIITGDGQKKIEVMHQARLMQ